MQKEVKGFVVSGTKEGKYYVERYNPYFIEKLGFSCFPGTLNIKTDGFSLPEKSILISPGNGFKDVKCFKIVINNKIEAAAVVPQMTRKDENVMEIVSRFNLREKLNLKNGDLVKLKFEV